MPSRQTRDSTTPSTAGRVLVVLHTGVLYSATACLVGRHHGGDPKAEHLRPDVSPAARPARGQAEHFVSERHFHAQGHEDVVFARKSVPAPWRVVKWGWRASGRLDIRTRKFRSGHQSCAQKCELPIHSGKSQGNLGFPDYAYSITRQSDWSQSPEVWQVRQQLDRVKWREKES